MFKRGKGSINQVFVGRETEEEGRQTRKNKIAEGDCKRSVLNLNKANHANLTPHNLTTHDTIRSPSECDTWITEGNEGKNR